MSQTIAASVRQEIIDALLERGYAVLEVVWVTNAQPLSWFGTGEGGYWAATYRNPLNRDTGFVSGAFLGAILRNIAALPSLVTETPTATN